MTPLPSSMRPPSCPGWDPGNLNPHPVFFGGGQNKGAHAYTHTQTCVCVSCCNVAGSQGRELRCVGSTLYRWRSRACIGCPPAGPDTELMVCSRSRM